MRTLAYCAASWAHQVRQAAGVDPLRSPPWSDGQITPELLEGHDLIYLDLHAQAGWACWQGDGGVWALCAGTVARADLAGVAVYATTCFADETEVLPAMVDAGAIVVAGSELNFEYESGPLRGVHLLGLWIRRGLALRIPVEAAVALGKLRVRAGGNSLAARDTAEFRIWRG